MNIHTILAALITGGLLTAFLKSNLDLYLIKKTNYLTKTQIFIHKTETTILFYIAFVISSVISIQLYGCMVIGFVFWISYLSNLAIMVLSYWILFDPLMAVGIGKKWNYLGDTARTDTYNIPIYLKILSLIMIIGFYYGVYYG